MGDTNSGQIISMTRRSCFRSFHRDTTRRGRDTDAVERHHARTAGGFCPVTRTRVTPRSGPEAPLYVGEIPHPAREVVEALVTEPEPLEDSGQDGASPHRVQTWSIGHVYGGRKAMVATSFVQFRAPLVAGGQVGGPTLLVQPGVPMIE